MADPGKGSNRRPAADESKFDDNFEKIFGKKKVTSGRRHYKWVSGEGFVEQEVKPALSSDLRFEGTFVSPVTGEVISNRYDLNDHNKKHGVEQILPGMEQDQAATRARMENAAFGKQAKREILEEVIQAVEKHS